MSIFWPIVWIGSILAALIAFIVTAMRERSKAMAAAAARQPKNLPVSNSDDMPAESMENLDNFDGQSFDFDDESIKS